ncbi:MAG: CvpA family protein [Bacteroidetes bacterium]|nr:CvpA family protein [Bacteroidota bacterium]
MNWFDWVIIGFLALGIYRGIRRGLLGQVIGLSSLIVAFASGYMYMDRAGSWFENQAGITPEYSSVIGFLVVFFSVFLGLSIIGGFVDKVVKSIPIIGWLNQLVGGALGFISVGLLLSLLLYLTSLMGFPTNDIIESSVTYDYVFQLLPQAWELATKQFPEIANFTDRFPSWF